MRFADVKLTVPTPAVVAGVQLKPFCLGHHLLFKRLGLPFAGNHEADCGAEDLILGIAVCGNSYEATLSAIHHGELAGIIARWRKCVGGPWWNPRTLDMDAEEVLFRNYLAEGYDMPPLWGNIGPTIQLTAPWELLLKNRLVAGGYSESEVLNGYLPARWFDYFTIIEMEAAKRCDDPKHWRKTFYTEEHAKELGK